MTEIRNIAIIAHVDHGKTTLVDGLLKQGGVFRENQQVAERVMDKMDLERERGITIVSKHTSVKWGDVKINIVDTPGHADFGGEVERVMGLVDGVLLLVDAVEGPMPQTRFVLSKALQAGHKAVVVVNKIDRADARPDYVINKTFDLFVDLGATEAQLDFPVVYASAITGRASLDDKKLDDNLHTLFDTIVSHIDPPGGDPDGPLQILTATLDYDEYRGRVAIGRVYSGTVRAAQTVTIVNRARQNVQAKLGQVFVYAGLARVEQEAVPAGEIIAVTGLPDINIGETICDRDNPVPLPVTNVDEPTLRMTFGVNTSPLAGREGQHSTSRKLRERLMKELQTNVALRVEETDSPDQFLVSGRGELHLAVLIETMRREGYELQVSQPEVILHEEDGKTLEPIEDVEIDVAEPYSGFVIEQLSRRRGEMRDMTTSGTAHVTQHWRVPTRGLLGFRNMFITETRGTGTLNSLFAGYVPYSGEISFERNGSLIAAESGVATPYGLANAEERGILFIPGGTEVYEGMIVGKNARDTDLEINICKAKHLTNMRSSNSDVGVRLTPHTIMSLDRCIEYIGPDDLVEVTPKNIRMRKRELDQGQRRKNAKTRS
ncbi:MAG: translational GTPase TypA [Capsulimonadaceae bacterium]|nr:translational GTPase TypA [Capsulimonadaceae bacterium]